MVFGEGRDDHCHPQAFPVGNGSTPFKWWTNTPISIGVCIWNDEGLILLFLLKKMHVHGSQKNYKH
jgi:hypothetical protein